MPAGGRRPGGGSVGSSACRGGPPCSFKSLGEIEDERGGAGDDAGEKPAQGPGAKLGPGARLGLYSPRPSRRSPRGPAPSQVQRNRRRIRHLAPGGAMDQGGRAPGARHHGSRGVIRGGGPLQGDIGVRGHDPPPPCRVHVLVHTPHTRQSRHQPGPEPRRHGHRVTPQRLRHPVRDGEPRRRRWRGGGGPPPFEADQCVQIQHPPHRHRAHTPPAHVVLTPAPAPSVTSRPQFRPYGEACSGTLVPHTPRVAHRIDEEQSPPVLVVGVRPLLGGPRYT